MTRLWPAGEAVEVLHYPQCGDTGATWDMQSVETPIPDSPTPAPGCLVVKKGSERWGSASEGMPLPVSVMAMAIQSPGSTPDASVGSVDRPVR